MSARARHNRNRAKYILYFVCCFTLLRTMLLARSARQQARPDTGWRRATRRTASGFPVTTSRFKIFIFCLASAWRRSAGRMFEICRWVHVPIIRRIVPSIEMVIFCAVGGRHSIVGAVVGTLAVNWAKTVFSNPS